MGTHTYYSYNCQNCGKRVHNASDVRRCLFCAQAVCKKCYQDGICPRCDPLFQGDERETYLAAMKKSGWIIAFTVVIPAILMSITIPLLLSSYFSEKITAWDYLLLVAVLAIIVVVCTFGTKGFKKNKGIATAIRKAINARGFRASQIDPNSLPETQFSQEATYNPSQKPSDEDGWK